MLSRPGPVRKQTGNNTYFVYLYKTTLFEINIYSEMQIYTSVITTRMAVFPGGEALSPPTSSDTVHDVQMVEPPTHCRRRQLLLADEAGTSRQLSEFTR